MREVIKLEEMDGRPMLSFWCPACKAIHMVDVGEGGTHAWNEDTEHPTVEPEIKMWSGRDGPGIGGVCALMILEGELAFQKWCTHGLANQTVPMEDVNDSAHPL